MPARGPPVSQTMTVTLALRDELSKGLAAQEGNLKRFSLGIGAAVAGAGIAVGGALGGAIKVAASFDQTMSNIGAVGGPAAADAMDQIRQKALDIGRDTAFGAGAAGSAIEELIKAGVDVKDVLGGAADATVALASAGEIALPEAAAITSAALNQFGLAGTDAAHVADLFAGAANASATDVREIGSAMTYVGPTAKALGQDIDNVSAAVGLLADQGIVGTKAGTSLRAGMLALVNPSKEGAAVLSGLGVNLKDVHGNMLPLPALFQELQTKTAGLGETERVEAFAAVVGREAVGAVLSLVDAGDKGFAKFKADMAQVSAADVAKQKLNNLAGSMTMLRGSVQTAGIMLGSAFQPVLQGTVQGISGLINATLPLIEQFAVTFPARLEAFKIRALGVFQGMSMWVQANWPLIATVVGMVGLTVGTTLLSMAGSVAMFGLALLLNGTVAVTSFAASIFTVGVPAMLSFIGMMVTTVIPNVIMFGSVLLTQGLGSALLFAAGILTGPIASVLTFAGVLLTQGIGAAVAFGLSLVSSNTAAGASFLINLIPNAIAAATTLVTTTIPAALATGVAFATTAAGSVVSFGSMLIGAVASGAGIAATFLTTTVPAMLVTANSFLVTSAGAVANFASMLAGALMAAPGIAATFVTTTIPAMVASAAAFIGTAATAVANFAIMLAGAIVTGAGIAVSFLTVTIPAAIAVGIGFIGMAITAGVAFAGMLAGAIMTGIGVALAFWPITLAIIAVVAIGFWLYKNWAMVWGAVVKYTGAAGQAIGRVLSSAMGWVTGLIGRAGDWIGQRFLSLKTMALGVISKMSLGVRKGIAGMANWVTGIIGQMASWVADKLAIMANAALDILSKIPGASAIIGIASGIGNGIKSMLKFAKENFDFGGAGEGAGEEFGEGFMHGTGSAAGSREGGGMGQGAASGGGGIAGLVGGAMDMLGIEMPAVPEMGASPVPGAGVGGGGGGGAGAKDPMGIWSGTDGKGAWTIDPATGKKIYDAGSVGAVGQQAAASDKASKEAAKQAKAGKGKSKIGAAVGKALKGDESLDLAKAFTAAISDAADLIGEIVGSDLPSRDQWMPKLDLIRSFFVDAGAVFASVAADARNKSDKITGKGAINKGDIENLMVFAEPWQSAMDMLSKTVSTMGDINDLKKIPDLGVMDGIEAFMMRAAAGGTRVLATIDRATAEVWTPVAGALSTWMDVIGKAAKTANDLATLDLKGDLMPALGRVETFMLEVAKRTGSFVASAQRALGYALADALVASRDVASTFGSWFDVLGKVGAAAKSVVDIKLPSNWQSNLAGFMTGVAAIGALYVTGLSNALPPEGRGPALALSRDVAGTFAAWGDGLVKIAGAADAIAKAKPVTETQLSDVRSLMGRVAEFGASFLKGPGYDLTKDAKRTAQDLGIVRDVFTTLSAGVDAVAKGGGLDLSKATRATADQLQIAQDNTRLALGSMSELFLLWSLFGSDSLLNGIKAYAATVGPVVDALAKASNLGLDKATRVTTDQLLIAEGNAAAAAAILEDLTVAYLGPDGQIPQRTLDMWAGAKAFGEMLGGAVDSLGKAGDLGLAEATRVTTSQLNIAWLNAADAAAILEDLAVDYLGPDGKLPMRTADMWAGAKAFAEHLGASVDMLSKAGNLGLGDATRVTTDQLDIAWQNAAGASAILEDLVVAYLGPDGKIPQTTLDMWTGGKAFAENLGSAVDMLGKAGGLGQDLLGAIRVTSGGLLVAEDNARTAFTSLQLLAADFTAMDKAARDAFYGPLADFSKTASEGIELLTKAAGLGLAVSKARPVTEQQAAMLRANILTAIRAVASVVDTAGPEALTLARDAAVKVGPVADAVGKVLEAFDIDKIMKSPLIVSKVGSAWMTGVRSKRAQAMADQIRSGLVLTFQTLGSAASGMPDVSSDVAGKIAMMVAAYDPLIGLIERLGSLKIDLGQVGMLAQVPGILGAGMAAGVGAGAGSGAGAPGAASSGPSIFTGPITSSGSVYFQGTLEVSLQMNGTELTKVQRSGEWQLSRGRAANAAAAA